MSTRIDEIADGIYRISTPSTIVPGGFTFNEFLVRDEAPLLFHAGLRKMFPELKEAVSKNRIPYLEQGVVDVVFSTMTANEERAQQIDFSDCYYVAGQSLLVPTDSAIADIGGLGGKTVGTVKGSTSEKNIREKAPDAKVELFDTYSEAVQAMRTARPGPAAIECAIDMWGRSADIAPVAPLPVPPTEIDEDAILAAAKILGSADRPFIVCGGGAVRFQKV